MAIERGLIGTLGDVDVPFEKARWIGGEIEPTLVVVHDTASGLSRGSAARYLQDNNAKVSVHFVIERDGSIVQQVPVDRRANHAGRSSFEGRARCNEFSIGIELVNPGRMTSANGVKAFTWFSEEFEIEKFGIQFRETPAHGEGWWMPYTYAQIVAVSLLLERLFEDVPSLTDIATHWIVSPGRKVDTNPLFPLDEIRSKVLGRDDPADERAWSASEETSDNSFAIVDLKSDTLNMRRWPSFNPNVIASIPAGVSVPVLRKGSFNGREWYLVQYDGLEGWVVASYMRLETSYEFLRSK